jgi:hypothetical protein
LHRSSKDSSQALLGKDSSKASSKALTSGVSSKASSKVAKASSKASSKANSKASSRKVNKVAKVVSRLCHEPVINLKMSGSESRIRPGDARHGRTHVGVQHEKKRRRWPNNASLP